MTAAKQPYFAKNRLRVCIDGHGSGLSGRVYSILQEEEIHFHDFSDFLVQIDKFFDRKGYPQSFQDKRSFRKDEGRSVFCPEPKICTPPEIVSVQKGKLATFDVIVSARRNTSWQGAVFTQEGELIEEFKAAVRIGEIMEAYM